MKFLFFILATLPAVVWMWDCADGDGIYEKGCKDFIKCVNGTQHHITCLEGMVFDEIHEICNDPKNVPKPCGEIIDCSTKKNGHYYDLYKGCHTYYTCQGNVFFGHNFCPGGLVFDIASQNCNWPHNVPPPCGTLVATTGSK